MNMILIFLCTLLGFGASVMITLHLATGYVRDVEKDIFWVNVYKNEDGGLFSDRMVDTEREAIFDAAGRKDFVKRIKVKV